MTVAALPYKSHASSLTTRSGQVIEVAKFDQPIAYLEALEAMSRFATERLDDEPDQIWVLEHPPVYTQGTACDMQLLAAGSSASAIPIVKSDRGGQITYHGPGQIIMYPLLKLKRYGLGVKALVLALEGAVINTLHDYGINSERRDDAPGVYVNGEKVAALGLRIRKGTSYHGLSFNIDMDLMPFSNIDPCGYQGLKVTQLRSLVATASSDVVRAQLLRHFVALI